MKTVQQEILCALLRSLLDKGLITQAVYDRSREEILSTQDWPDFADIEKEGDHGGA